MRSRVVVALLTIAGVTAIVWLARPNLGAIQARTWVWAFVATGHALAGLMSPPRSQGAALTPLLSLIAGAAILSWPVAVSGVTLAGVLAAFLAGYLLRPRMPVGDALLVLAATILIGEGPRWGYSAFLVAVPLVFVGRVAPKPSAH